MLWNQTLGSFPSYYNERFYPLDSDLNDSGKREEEAERKIGEHSL